ncbi:hypothetical protein OsI_30974 [Oryza sativa Indica Group]|uniref:Uncharacterized protein n=1 Tax=Oryza sativa subsp. indica TaxID=39946 RepID=A2Z045_ORYSI|nr:hypothetical protein OsI_30974 [Oryza sativa Indica Group]
MPKIIRIIVDWLDRCRKLYPDVRAGSSRRKNKRSKGRMGDSVGLQASHAMVPGESRMGDGDAMARGGLGFSVSLVTAPYWPPG